MSRQFIDRLRVFIKAGSGAAGNPKVRGKGGDGGSIYAVACENYTLAKLLASNPKKRFKAEHGYEAGKRGGLIGRDGRNLNISVPVGVSISIDRQRAKTPPTKLGDLDAPNQRLLVAQGGSGGTQATGYVGGLGQAVSAIFDLKLMADFSLLGLPNAGKSSLLRALSGAQTKIASYPFTTVRPQLATCVYPDGRQISLADLPGLGDIYAEYTSAAVPTATTPEGPGQKLPPLRHTSFLKHIERSSCIIMVLDVMGFCKDQHSSWRSPLSTAYLILHLMERWCLETNLGVSLAAQKPLVCVVNKIDMPEAEKAVAQWMPHLESLASPESRTASGLPVELLPQFVPPFEDIVTCSAKFGTNVEALKIQLRKYLDDLELKKRKFELQELAETEDSKNKRRLIDAHTSQY